MLADLDLLLTSVFCTADDLLPEGRKNARRRLTDAEVVTLCAAQSIMGVGSDERFLKIAVKRLGHLFPALTGRSGFHRRRDRLAETIEALIAAFASRSPGYHDDLLLVDSTPVECARSRETVKRGGSSCLGDALADAADYGYCASHSRWFWGFRLHTLMAPDGTPRAMALTSPKEGEREVCLRLLGRVNRSGPLVVLGDKGYAGAGFQADAAGLGATVVRPRRKDEPSGGPHLAPLRQRIESIFWTAKDILGLERHGARTLRGLRVRIAARFLALAAAISLNHELGRPSRALVDYRGLSRGTTHLEELHRLRPGDRQLAKEFLLEARAITDKRNDYVHNLWPAQGDGRLFGWRAVSKKKAAGASITNEATLEEMRYDLKRLVDLLEVNRLDRFLGLASEGRHPGGD